MKRRCTCLACTSPPSKLLQGQALCQRASQAALTQPHSCATRAARVSMAPGPPLITRHITCGAIATAPTLGAEQPTSPSCFGLVRSRLLCQTALRTARPEGKTCFTQWKGPTRDLQASKLLTAYHKPHDKHRDRRAAAATVVRVAAGMRRRSWRSAERGRTRQLACAGFCRHRIRVLPPPLLGRW